MQGLVIAALLLIAAPVAAPPAQINSAEQLQLQQNLDLGKSLYHYDQSAWHVTDAALAALPEEARSLIRGYVTTPGDGGLRTTFFGGEGENFALYSAVWTGAKIDAAKLHSAQSRFPVTAEERRMIEARKAALERASELKFCADAPPNVITVPHNNGVDVSVYMLTPQIKTGSFPFGGHHRIDVRDGKVNAVRPFAKSCIEMSVDTAPAGARPGAVWITHLLDPVPTEIHVFNMLAMRVPIYVRVRDGRIYVVESSAGHPRARLLAQK